MGGSSFIPYYLYRRGRDLEVCMENGGKGKEPDKGRNMGLGVLIGFFLSHAIVLCLRLYCMYLLV